MKKVLFLMCCLALTAAMIGCSSTKVYKTTRDRVDIEVAGNQGIIYGPTPAPHKVAVPQRDIIAIDVELSTTDEVKATLKSRAAAAPTPDEGVSGNAGMVSQEEPQTPPSPAAAEQKQEEKIK